MADRGARFWASLIDGALAFSSVVPVFVLAGVTHKPELLPLAGVMLPALCLYQWRLLATSGQSLGKRWLKIKIVKTSGRPVDFASAVVARIWVPTFVAFIPAFPLIDVLFIFRADRRCIHDLFAGTKVIAA